jgi:hypothetical protein
VPCRVSIRGFTAAYHRKTSVSMGSKITAAAKTDPWRHRDSVLVEQQQMEVGDVEGASM